MNAAGGKQLAQAQGRVIIRRREVVLGIEEQQDVDFRWHRFGVDGRHQGGENEISERPNEPAEQNGPDHGQVNSTNALWPGPTSSLSRSGFV